MPREEKYFQAYLPLPQDLIRLKKIKPLKLEKAEIQTVQLRLQCSDYKEIRKKY